MMEALIFIGLVVLFIVAAAGVLNLVWKAGLWKMNRNIRRREAARVSRVS